MECYKDEIARLNERGGYVTADVINVSPATPGLDAMLQKFSPEHTHSEDEVRFVVHGRGVFHINPVEGPVFAIEMESGDLINVPAGTRHWFNLCDEKTIVTIRLFQDTTGWTPHYLEKSKHLNYQPLCLGPKPTVCAGGSRNKQVSIYKADDQAHTAPLVITKARCILIDVEGTTSSISFVYDVLFPFARTELRDYLRLHWHSASVQKALDYLASELGFSDTADWLNSRRNSTDRLK